MYKATITKKKLEKDKLAVEVTFENSGGTTYVESFETNQFQDPDWLTRHIARYLQNLNSFEALHENIVLGPFVPPTAENPNRDLYKQNAMAYMQYMEIARLGIIPSDRPIISELRAWLRTHFKDEYLNLF